MNNETVVVQKQTSKPADGESVLNAGLAAAYMTEAMIDAPRGFLLGLEIGQKSLEKMRIHLDNIGCKYDCWPDWAKNDKGHITKAGKAILIYTMIEAANVKLTG